jgi:hypothetical protein
VPNGIVIGSPCKDAFDYLGEMCQNLNVANTSILLRILLIVGLVVSPLAPPVFAASGHTMELSAAPMSPDEMSPGADTERVTSPCDDCKADCDKVCPCMAACMSLSVQCLPSIASTIARVVIVGQRFAIRSEAQLASLAAPPPARPPRA